FYGIRSLGEAEGRSGGHGSEETSAPRVDRERDGRVGNTGGDRTVDPGGGAGRVGVPRDAVDRAVPSECARRARGPDDRGQTGDCLAIADLAAVRVSCRGAGGELGIVSVPPAKTAGPTKQC